MGEGERGEMEERERWKSGCDEADNRWHVAHLFEFTKER
jgi:hypothetical protein